jgi:hypothetical protein
MTSDNRAEYELRESILKLLSDAEIAKVSTAETAPVLAEGDEYLDLEKLGEGVSRADGDPVPIGRVLPRAAVRPATWSEIMSELAKKVLPS